MVIIKSKPSAVQTSFFSSIHKEAVSIQQSAINLKKLLPSAFCLLPFIIPYFINSIFLVFLNPPVSSV